MSSIDEKSLLPKLLDGDEKAFEAIFRFYYTKLVWFVYKYLKSKDASEEVVQDLFLAIWEKRSTLNITTSLKAYLYTSARNRSFNYLKRHANLNVSLEEHEYRAVAENQEADVSVNYSETKKAINDALALLPAQCRKIFEMSRNELLTYKEIADVLGLSIKTVETQMGRALKSMRNNLKEFI